jgi:hypothetical protein
MTASPLRAALDAVIAEQGCSLKDLTVPAAKNDPFRLDTPARHRDGLWLAETAAELGLGQRKIHLRGLHYMVLGRTMPDGSQYVNDNDHWEWLQSDDAKAARFLGYLPFDQITDQRNAEPVVRVREGDQVEAYLTTELDVSILGVGPGRLTDLYVAWLAVPGVISLPDPPAADIPAYGRPVTRWDPMELATAAPWTIHWLPPRYEQNFWNAA